MIYKILTIADIHFGALDPKRLYDELSLVKDYLKNNKIDLLVIDGDYWDSKHSLNTKIAHYGVKWMNELHSISVENDFQIRIVLGTKSHDFDQLDVFDCLVGDHLKIFRENTYEETLPGLHALYCPDETMKTEDYVETYINNVTREGGYDIGFFHGNFDIIMIDIPLQETEIQSINNVIFNYDMWNSIIKGPMIAGHWHTHREFNKLTYVGSFSRFGFGEEEPKGFLVTEIDIDDDSFKNTFIENTSAQIYKSYIINTQIFFNIDDYSKILNHIRDEVITNPDMKVRVRIDVMDDEPMTKKFVDITKNFFIDNRHVKVVYRNKFLSDKKKEKEEDIKKEIEDYDYIEDSTLSIEEKLQKYMMTQYDIDIPMEFILKYTNKIKG